jgi:hypothetical protein
VNSGLTPLGFGALSTFLGVWGTFWPRSALRHSRQRTWMYTYVEYGGPSRAGVIFTVCLGIFLLLSGILLDVVGIALLTGHLH